MDKTKSICIPEKFTNDPYLNVEGIKLIHIIKECESKAKKIVFKKVDDLPEINYIRKLQKKERAKRGWDKVQGTTTVYLSFWLPQKICSAKLEKAFLQSQGKYLIGVLE
jgi:hypothetical protein